MNQIPENRIDRRLAAEPVSVGDVTLQPVARLQGWHFRSQEPGQRGGGTAGRIVPLEVNVRSADGEYTLSLEDPTVAPLKGILSGALALGALAGLLIGIARVIERRSA